MLKDLKWNPSKKEPKKKEEKVILEYDESIIGGLPGDYRPIGDEVEYDEVPLIESLSWFDYDVQLRGTDFIFFAVFENVWVAPICVGV